MSDTTKSIWVDGEAPKFYQCCDCDAKNVKLWRPYNSFNITLKCLECSEKERGKPRDKGTDQIGWRIPAVPCDESPYIVDGKASESYWGYTSVPEPGVDWWKSLEPKFDTKIERLEERRKELQAHENKPNDESKSTTR